METRPPVLAGDRLAKTRQGRWLLRQLLKRRENRAAAEVVVDDALLIAEGGTSSKEEPHLAIQEERIQEESECCDEGETTIHRLGVGTAQRSVDVQGVISSTKCNSFSHKQV